MKGGWLCGVWCLMVVLRRSSDSLSGLSVGRLVLRWDVICQDCRVQQYITSRRSSANYYTDKDATEICGLMHSLYKQVYKKSCSIYRIERYEQYLSQYIISQKIEYAQAKHAPSSEDIVVDDADVAADKPVISICHLINYHYFVSFQPRYSSTSFKYKVDYF